MCKASQDKFNVDISRKWLQEYLDITHSPKTPKASRAAEIRKNELKTYIFTEAFAPYADLYTPVEPELEVVS